MAETSAKLLANLFGITERRIHQLAKEGLPKQRRGKFDLLKCIRWYVRFLHATLEKKTIPTGDSYFGEREERIRSIRADADLKEMELAQKRSQLVSTQEVDLAMTDLVRTTKTRILALAPRIAPRLVGVDSRVMAQAILEKALKETMRELSKHEAETA